MEAAAKEEAQAHAAVLRKRTRILWIVLVVTTVVAVAAVVLGVLAFTNQQKATAQRLVAEAQSMIGGQRPGGEVRGLQELLAANALAPKLVEAS